MALVRTNVSAGSAHSGTVTSGSFTPANNSLIVVGAMEYLSNSDCSVSGGGLTWTKRVEQLQGSYYCSIWTAPVTTGASMTVTVSGGHIDPTNHYHIVYYTGYNGVGTSGSQGFASPASPLSYNLLTTPASTSEIFAVYETQHDSDTIAAGTGWTSVFTEHGVTNYDGTFSFAEASPSSTAVTTGTTSLGGGASCSCALEITAAAGGSTTPADCSFLFQPTQLRRPVPIVNIQQRKAYASQDNATPSPLAFWFQPPFLGPIPQSTQNTNQAFFNSPQEPKTPTSALTFRPHALLRHIPTIYTAQSFVCNPTIGPPVPVDAFWVQPPDLLNHPHSLDTNQPKDNLFAGWTNNTPSSLGFWTQPQDLLRHKATLDTNQPVAAFIAPAAPVPSNQVNEYWSFAPIGHLAIGQGTLPTGTPTPADCSFLFEPSALLNHPSTLDTNQPKDNFFAGWANATPTQFGFWTQAQDLLRHPSALDTNQSLDQGWTQQLTPSSLAFWRQPEDLLRHPNTVDTNQPLDATFAGWANATPSSLGFFTQAPNLLKHPVTIGTDQAFDAAYTAWGLANFTPSDASFWTQPQDLLRHPNTVDTNQPLNDAFFGWAQNLTPTSLGFFTQAPDLLRHPATLDTRQQFEFNPPPGAVTPADCSFLYQPSALLNHPATLDTNQSLDDTFFGWQRGVTPTALGFWTQAPDLTRHPVTIDTNQSRVSYQDKATPSALGFWTQAPDLLRHASTIDTNQAFVFNPPVPGATPSALWWFQPPDLLRHAPHLDTNLPRLVSQVGATPSALAWWRQPEDLFKHPATLNTQQSFEYLPPPQPPFGWLIQAQDLLRHPIPFILGMQPFAELPPVIHTNRLIKVYFFD